MTTWLDTVAGIVGPRHLITDPDTLAAACLDWRGRYRGRAQAIARPGSTAEVAALVRACVAAGAPIVPQGGNTSHCGAATPDDSGRALIIQLHRMQALRAVDADNNTLTAEAGFRPRQAGLTLLFVTVHDKLPDGTWESHNAALTLETTLPEPPARR